MALLTIVQPTQEPVSLAQMKSYMRISTTADDELITELITASRAWCENFMERSILFQTKRLLLDFFPGYVDFKMTGQKVSSPFVSGANAVLVGIRYAIVLPFPQVRSIVDFIYQDQNGNNQTMVQAVSYNADLDSQPARLTPPFGNMWPVARVVPNAVQVDYVTGSQGPISITLAAGSAAVSSTFNFLPRDAGTVLTIPGAGAVTNGQAAALTTTIASVNTSGQATLAAPAVTSVTGVSVWFDGMPQMRIVKNAIKSLVNYWYQNRMADGGQIPDGVKAMLSPFRDQRL